MKLVRLSAGIVGIGILSVVLAVLWGMEVFRIKPFRQSAAERVLCGSDHEALLKAGREILGQVPPRPPDPRGRRIQGTFNIPDRIEIPRVIRNLRPRLLCVSHDGYLIIEMSGNRDDHFGVRIYPDGFHEPEVDFFYGDRELLEGMWYYDDGYLDDPMYDKKIDSIMDKCSKLTRRASGLASR